ncbi:Reverse transcriptase domain-containing protein [Aphis craccivora]|uniref:Reverse transcriptase domain-containing protein n=1 Tax=Aphis craccivora TaxID=307492 RepID=A0A6G0ZFH6_APHCR|nr:Reverse transcriptase domain-containing protein [Aphis craccivora]
MKAVLKWKPLGKRPLGGPKQRWIDKFLNYINDNFLVFAKLKFNLRHKREVPPLPHHLNDYANIYNFFPIRIRKT